MELLGSGSAVFLSLGSNLGDRLGALNRALECLSNLGVKIERSSSVYETEPVGFRDQPDFLNLVSLAATRLSPSRLLAACKSVELEMGRQPAHLDGPRLIDIDILFFGQRVLNTPELKIPHPSFHLRRFVLVPLAELAPQLRDPRSGRTIREFLEDCPDSSWVRQYTQS